MNSFQKGVKGFAIFLAICLIFTIFSSISFGFSLLSFMFDHDYTVNQENYKQTFTDVQEIQLESRFSKVLVTTGEEFMVEAYDLERGLVVKQDKNRLKIEEEGALSFFQKGGTIRITVPQVLLDEIKISAGAGEVLLDGVSSSSLDLDQGAGFLKITNSTFYDTHIDGGAGRIVIENSALRNLDLDTGAGEVSINASLTGKNEIDCGVGSVTVFVQGAKDDYQLYLEKGLGVVTLNKEQVSGDYRFGNGIHSLHIEGGVGNISLDFES